MPRCQCPECRAMYGHPERDDLMAHTNGRLSLAGTTSIVGLLGVVATIAVGWGVLTAKVEGHADIVGHPGMVELVHETREMQRRVEERVEAVKEDIGDLRTEQRAMTERILEAVRND